MTEQQSIHILDQIEKKRQEISLDRINALHVEKGTLEIQAQNNLDAYQEAVAYAQSQEQQVQMLSTVNATLRQQVQELETEKTALEQRNADLEAQCTHLQTEVDKWERAREAAVQAESSYDPQGFTEGWVDAAAEASQHETSPESQESESRSLLERLASTMRLTLPD